MNRDEKRTRSRALPPAIVNLESVHAIFPREHTGGTWIAVNDRALCLALINWHRIDHEPVGDIISRGAIIPALAGKSSSAEIATAIRNLPLSQLRPFRLITIIGSEQTLLEWRWNLHVLTSRKHLWEIRHWFSSGYDEPRAELLRRRVCRKTRERSAVGLLAWLRELHRSHLPERGPFSICMHRNDATTVSYTEIHVLGRRVQMSYKPGPPCGLGRVIMKSLLRQT